MKGKEEIKLKIGQLKLELSYWEKVKSEYKWTDYTREHGSTTYGSYQEKESACAQKIELLEWVLSE